MGVCRAAHHPGFCTLQNEITARVSTMERLLQRSSTMGLQPGPGAAPLPLRSM